MLIKERDVNLKIRDKRIQLGISEAEVSKICSMTESEYRDIEDYNDELFMVVPLRKVACLCNSLGITLEELYGYSSHNTLFPQDVISRRLQEKKMTILELSDLVGIEESYIEATAHDIMNIGDWVVYPIMTLSEKLGVSLGAILESYFRYYQANKS
ncbi:MAG: XRE family transcriptional regulator [Candidatus Electrothrix sp. ATG2]|nr:XRE family transcriptional regulator [Candidatus Electrothrix sp. ATG2]